MRNTYDMTEVGTPPDKGYEKRGQRDTKERERSTGGKREKENKTLISIKKPIGLPRKRTRKAPRRG